MTLRAVEPGETGERRRWGRAGAAAPSTPDVAELYRELAPAVLGYVRSQRAADPEDLLGEIFLQVVRDIGHFHGDDAAVRRWVFTIARHRVIDARRRSKRRPAAGDCPPELPAPAAPDPFDPELVQALAALTAEQREVVTLRFVADLPIDAVAAITGRTPGAVKALQHRALDALARQLGDGWPPISAVNG